MKVEGKLRRPFTVQGTVTLGSVTNSCMLRHDYRRDIISPVNTSSSVIKCDRYVLVEQEHRKVLFNGREARLCVTQPHPNYCLGS